MKTLGKSLIIVSLLLFNHVVKGQNLIVNSDFEDFIDCPTGQGQADRATGWFVSIISSDYFNCDYVSVNDFPTTSLAYSGAGFIGFLSYGDDNGSAEAIGQDLSQPLLPNHDYSIQFAAKRPHAGSYANNCGGVEIYGFKNDPPNNDIFIHASQHPNANLLAASETIQDITWQLHTLDLNVTDTINTIVVTISLAEACLQYIFLDSLSIVEDIKLATSSIHTENNKLKLYPNPANQQITIETEMHGLDYEVEIIDLSGKILLRQKMSNTTQRLNVENLSRGLYLCRVSSEQESITRKLMIGK